MNQTSKTERLLLRPLDDKDAERIALLANNWKVTSMTGCIPHPCSEGNARNFLAQISSLSARGRVFAITRDNLFIGCIGIESLKPDPVDFELGHWLGEPYWGQGFATEAGAAIVAFGFGALGLSRVASGHFTDNPASGRVLRKLGFRYSGRTKRHCLARGQDVDMCMMALSRAEWGKQ